jgi:tRNA pseudouridine32 synthase/23S rRNA pseudouridine746 synthase
VNKPTGVLSVPGVVGGISVEQWLRQEYIHSDHLYVVHRLDMSTSGLLVAAKSLDVYKQLQRQFAEREVKKQYTAILEGIPQKGEGVIELPLAADYDNRPRQKVDFVNGKRAVTRYRVVDTLEREGRTCAVVCFEPMTGRTHQLRVHAASCQGLDCPIFGDSLYGTTADRLMLHASRLEFFHPINGEKVVIESKVPFIK